jgi:hypothetical protein
MLRRGKTSASYLEEKRNKGCAGSILTASCKLMNYHTNAPKCLEHKQIARYQLHVIGVQMLQSHDHRNNSQG